MPKKISDDDYDELEKLLNQTDGVEDENEELINDPNNDFNYDLVLYNDDFNHIQYVISCIIDILFIPFLQADQLVTLIHFKGEASVKKSNDLRLMKSLMKRFINSGISCEIRTINVSN